MLQEAFTINTSGSVYNPTYNSEPFVDFEKINPSSDIENINLNWREKDLPERIRTKHVHRLHPYLGKFIPQLVEIFLRKYEPNVVYDPFVGSGTTLVEANALGTESIGCDISEFNILLSKVKTDKYDVVLLEKEIKDMIKQFRIKNGNTLYRVPRLTTKNEYINKWFAEKSTHELLLFKSLIQNYQYQDVFKIILSRAARSARLTTHYDLDFPKNPQTEPYSCFKHRRICEPVGSAEQFLIRYSYDTLRRIKEFSKVRSDAKVHLFCGDSRTTKIPKYDLLITSPPYLGLIDYHEQHRYAFEIFDLERRDDHEIGPAFKGQSNGAKDDYVKKIYEVFNNSLNFMNDGGRFVVVVGDKKNLYGPIREKLGLIEEYKISRHVNRRTGRRNSDFYEDVLVWKAT
jgi:hypothetical protein